MKGGGRCDLCNKERARRGFLLCQSCFDAIQRVKQALVRILLTAPDTLLPILDCKMPLRDRGDDRREETKVKAAAASVSEVPVKFIGD